LTVDDQLPDEAPVAWGIFALRDGKWALQNPAHYSAREAAEEAMMFRTDASVLEVRALYAAPLPPEPRLTMCSACFVEVKQDEGAHVQ
jgi:hypothetical protein